MLKKSKIMRIKSRNTVILIMQNVSGAKKVEFFANED